MSECVPHPQNSVSECLCLLTLLLDLPTVNLKFKSFMDFCVTYISGVFVLVIFDSLLKEFDGIMAQL